MFPYARLVDFKEESEIVHNVHPLEDNVFKNQSNNSKEKNDRFILN